MHGVPYAAKDIFDIEGMATTCHSKIGGAAAWVSPARAQEPRQVIGVLSSFGFPGLFAEV